MNKRKQKWNPPIRDKTKAQNRKQNHSRVPAEEQSKGKKTKKEKKIQKSKCEMEVFIKKSVYINTTSTKRAKKSQRNPKKKTENNTKVKKTV